MPSESDEPLPTLSGADQFSDCDEPFTGNPAISGGNSKSRPSAIVAPKIGRAAVRHDRGTDMKLLSLPSTGIQSSESGRVIKIRVFLVHLLSLGIFFVPYTHELAIATAISYFIRVSQDKSCGGDCRYGCWLASIRNRQPS
jgi:hypothetical protein